MAKTDAKATEKTDKKVAENPAEAAPKKEKKFQNPFSFSDPLQTKVVNCLMKNGKKTVAQRILKDTFAEINRRGNSEVLKTFETALANVTPAMECKPKRVGGAIYQIPREVGPKRQQTLAIRWILDGARKKSGQPMSKRLASELLDAANQSGFAFAKKEEAHKMAQSNKAFAHLARY